MIEKNKDLSLFNSFGLDIKSRLYQKIDAAEDIFEILDSNQFQEESCLVLGGGSNILFTKDFSGLIIHNRIKGIDIVEENADRTILKIGAGENWHETVLHCIQNNWGGIENLSLIPGCIGAAPIQNIGAYGVELKDVFHGADFTEFSTGKSRFINKVDCQFGYRDSVFKRELRGKGIITHVYLELSKFHNINIDYGSIRATLEESGIKEPSIADVSKAVIEIRQSKLPDPAKIGNAGSFFKNPVIPMDEFQVLKETYPTIPGYTNSEMVKVPAGWLIEKSGWKGYRKGSIGVHKNQALVLVNYGNGSGSDIKDLAREIQQSILNQFGISLETEVNII